MFYPKRNRMKKMMIAALACLLTAPVWAEGYQVNVLSAKQTGMGHVGVARRLGAESMHFNPAGLAGIDRHMDISVGISGVSATAKYKNDGYSAKTDNPVSTPFYAYVGYKIYDNLAGGISVTTPYGNTLKWPKNWNGSHLIQDISLKSFVFQPTLSYKITDKLSIGAGLMLAVGNVELSRSLMSKEDFQMIGTMIANHPGLPDEAKQQIVDGIRANNYPPAAATLDGKAGVRAGFNVGLMYEVSDSWTIGASYRSKIKMKVKEGDASLSYANQTVENLMGTLGTLSPNLAVPKYDQGTFRAELPLPSNLTFGVNFHPGDKWEVEADVQFVGWNAYDSLNVFFNEEELEIKPIKAEKNYRNTFIVRLGSSCRLTDRFTMRGGVYFDQSPIRKNNYNPETPGMDKLGISTGCSFEPYQNLSLDFAFLYIQGFSRDGSYTSPNIVIAGQQDLFSGRYQSHATTVSLGLSYKF